MQCLRVSLNLFLFCCVPFPLGFLNHPIRSGCCGCRQFPFSSIVHQIDHFFPAIIPDKASQLTHPVCTRLTPSHRPGTHPFRIHAAYMAFRTTPKDVFVRNARWIYSQFPIRYFRHSSTAWSLPSQWFFIRVRSFLAARSLFL